MASATLSSSNEVAPSSANDSSSGSSIPHLTVAKSAAIASAITKSVLHPIDTIKCRYQVTTNVSSPTEFLRYWKGKWSPRHLYSGLGIKLAAYVPFQSTYMTSYNWAKTHLANEADSHPYGLKCEKTGNLVAPKTITVVGSALFADVVSSFIRVPMEAVKMRLQSSVYESTWQAVQCLHLDGLRQTARLFIPQTLIYDMPLSIVQFLAYENLKPKLYPIIESGLRAFHNDGKEHDEDAASLKALVPLLSGGISGCIAGCVTTPMDVIKTRVVVESATARSTTTSDASSIPRGINKPMAHPNSVSKAIRTIYAERGVLGFFRGVSIRMLWISTNVGVYFAMFEALKARSHDKAATSSASTPH